MFLQFLRAESSNGQARMDSFRRLQGRIYFPAFSCSQRLLILPTPHHFDYCFHHHLFFLLLHHMSKNLWIHSTCPSCKDSCDSLGSIQIKSYLKLLNLITSAHSTRHIGWCNHKVLEIRILTSQEGHYSTYHTLQLVFFSFSLCSILHCRKQT